MSYPDFPRYVRPIPPAHMPEDGRPDASVTDLLTERWTKPADYRDDVLGHGEAGTCEPCPDSWLDAFCIAVAVFIASLFIAALVGGAGVI